MSDPRRDWEVRFGIELDGRRSRWYRVRSAAQLPQLYVEREGLDKAAHVSLHTSKRWHVQIRHHGQVIKWSRPAEVTPGFTRALVIVQPAAVVVVDEPQAPDDVVLIPITADADPVHFDVFLEQPGANMATWPGKNAMGTVLVGRVPLANGAGTWCVVAHHADLASDRVTLPRPDPDEVERMRAEVAKGDRYMTLFAIQADGAMALIDGRAELGDQY